jgi:hypothetical protein
MLRGLERMSTMEGSTPTPRPVIPHIVAAPQDSFRHELEVDGQKIFVEQRLSSPVPGYEVLELEIQASSPARFRIDLPVPADCWNACVTLGEESVLDWFSDEIPEGLATLLPGLSPSCGCEDCRQEGKTRNSPLCPGRTQSLVFRWLPGDMLRLHLILPTLSKAGFHVP